MDQNLDQVYAKSFHNNFSKFKRGLFQWEEKLIMWKKDLTNPIDFLWKSYSGLANFDPFDFYSHSTLPIPYLIIHLQLF